MTLSIPRRLESPNQSRGAHWRVRHRITQEWERAIWDIEVSRPDLIADLAIALRRGPKDWMRMRVEIERHVPSKRNFIRDDDNLAFAKKPLLDALKRRGWIKDDSRKWCESPLPTQHVSVDGQDRTVIQISIVSDGGPTR